MIKAIELDKEGVSSGYEMTLDNFRNPFECIDNIRLLVRLGKRYADIGAYIQAEGLWLYEES